MLKNGFNVDAIDCSIEGIRKLKTYATETRPESSKSNFICGDVGNFIIKKNKYKIVNIINVLHFLDKNLALELIDDVKKNIQTGGHVLISNFTTKDPSFKNSKNKLKCFFKLNELKNLFCDFELIEYEEKIVMDKGHLGKEQAHHHGIVSLLAKRPSFTNN